MLLNLWARKLAKGFRKSTRRAQAAMPVSAEVESCESRTCLSVTSVFTSATGELVVTSDGSDSIFIGANRSGQVTLNGRTMTATVDGTNGPVQASSVQTLIVDGGAGNNVINLRGVTAGRFFSLTNITVDGGAGNDRIAGSDLAESLSGGLGNDSISGNGGSDDLHGDEGNDSLAGGNGFDSLDGGEGNDRLDGENGNDDLNGGDGDDRENGGSGDDLIQGGLGSDTLVGGTGNNSLFGDDGNDSLKGDSGRDDLHGGNGDDSLSGGGLDDSLEGDDGNDLLRGESGNDSLNGGAGDDNVDGGSGDDLVEGGDGHDHLVGGVGSDVFHNDNNDDANSDEDQRDGVHEGESKFYASLTAIGDGSQIGSAKFESKTSSTKREFELSVRGAAAGSYNVLVGGENVGTLTVSSRGAGRLKLTTNPHESGEQAFPANFPAIQTGTTVVVEGLLQGTF